MCSARPCRGLAKQLLSPGPEPQCPSHGALRPEWDNCGCMGGERGPASMAATLLSPFQAGWQHPSPVARGGCVSPTRCAGFVARTQLLVDAVPAPPWEVWGFLRKSFPGWCLRAGEVNNTESVVSSVVDFMRRVSGLGSARSVQAAHGSDSRLSHRCWTRICSVAPELSALLSRYVMGTQQLPSIAAVNHNSPQKSLFFGGCRLKMTEASFVFLFQEKCPTVSP